MQQLGGVDTALHTHAHTHTNKHTLICAGAQWYGARGRCRQSAAARGCGYSSTHTRTHTTHTYAHTHRHTHTHTTTHTYWFAQVLSGMERVDAAAKVPQLGGVDTALHTHAHTYKHTNTLICAGARWYGACGHCRQSAAARGQGGPQ